MAGVLGQVNAVLELAEQICRKECPDPDAIYLPVGSACTVTGSLFLHKRVLPKRPDPRHFPSSHASSFPWGTRVQEPETQDCRGTSFPHFRRASSAVRVLYLILEPAFCRFPHVWDCKYLRIVSAAGRPGSERARATRCFHLVSTKVFVPTLTHAPICSNVEFVTEDDLISPYGAHSPRSTKAAKKADEDLEVEGPLPWICGHFVAKPWSVMMDRLGQGYADGESVLFWLTKSLVQPVDQDGDELARLRKLAAATPGLDEWTTGSASSRRRQGKVDIVGGKAADYRHLMTYRDKGE